MHSYEKKNIVYQEIITASKKIGLPENRLRVYEQKYTMERFKSPKIYQTSYQYCILIGYINHMTAENKWEYNISMTYNIFWALEPLHGRFLFINAQTIFRQAYYFMKNRPYNYVRRCHVFGATTPKIGIVWRVPLLAV